MFNKSFVQVVFAKQMLSLTERIEQGLLALSGSVCVSDDEAEGGGGRMLE